MTSESDLRSDLVKFGKLAYDRRLTFASGGNISARLDDKSMIITPSGTCKGMLHDEEMIKVSLANGSHEGARRPSMETPFHSGIYLARSDVGAVIHCHPLHCTALAVMGITLRPAITPEGVLVLGENVPTADYATPGTRELAKAVVNGLGRERACLMSRHGVIAVGKDLEEAFNRLETMEYIATLQLKCSEIGRLEDIPSDEVARILQK